MTDLEDEQHHVTRLYDRLDTLRTEAEREMAGLLKESGGTPQARSQRDSTARTYAERIAALDTVQNGLCFGRLDFADGTRHHIGRIGIHDSDHEPLQLDWRAPAARPFYIATAASPGGVQRRRHIRTQGRTVVRLDDEVLATQGTGEELTGEAALLAAVSAPRTGHMRDIVETIQAEQDRAIRADPQGVLVIQGGPGTGKTAVALHRAAYLLYTYREQLSRRGILIVGPHATFLQYISQVLPSLAETGALLATVADLFPGITATAPESPQAAELKGRMDMADFVAAAVRDKQRVPQEPIGLQVDGNLVWLYPADCAAARLRARNSLRPHNLARAVFADYLLDALARQLAEGIGFDPYWNDPLGENDAPGDPYLLDEGDIADIREDLAANAAVQEVLADLWPVLTAEQLLSDAYACTQVELLRRNPGGEWTPSDVPLLDEAAELLGEDDTSARVREALLRRARVAYAQGVLDISAGSADFELEGEAEEGLANIVDVLDAEAIAARYAAVDQLSAAARAAADRTWAFGHIIVDEAQELSPMAWRLLMRRCPSRSMTVVGDLAQTGAPGGARSWADVFEPYVGDRWRRSDLTVSYRTPAEVMAVVARMMADVDPSIQPPRSVRRSGIEPLDESGDLDRLAGLVQQEAKAVGEGRLAVIAPAARIGELAHTMPELAVGGSPDLGERAILLEVRQAKGLEFDTVVAVDPDAILAESPRGASDLYVTLTRPTQRLVVYRLTE